MSGAELVFNPETEYEIIEEFEFDEDVQRPEAVRFFTYTEQAGDFMEKLLPKKGKVSKGDVRAAEKQVDAFTLLYKQLIQETPDGFIPVPQYTAPKTLPWVRYTNIDPANHSTPFRWTANWTPLYGDAEGLTPNYYIRMLDSLPKSAVTWTPDKTGEGVPVYDAAGKVLIDGRYFLDKYVYSKTRHRDDGTFQISRVPREDTQDAVRFRGYSVENPPLAPPNPVENHPFLSAHPDPVVIESDEPLREIMPSLETIFQHAIPETSDPYGVASPYLKIYDVKLRDVPANLWSMKFPPLPIIEETPPPRAIEFAAGSQDAPPKTLIDAYKSAYLPGLSSRKWLSETPDGGALLAKILLSESGNVGILPIPPPSLLPDGVAGILHGTPEECLPPEITGFDDFLTRGIYRAPKCTVCGATGHGGKQCPDKKGKVDFQEGYGCIPLATVAFEREFAPYVGKAPWVPGTDESLLKTHQTFLKKRIEFGEETFARPPSVDPAAAPNETRMMISTILSDEFKVDEDKLSDIQVLLKEGTTLENHIYKDATTGAFLICEHELEQLRGEFAKNPRAYLQTWCAKYSGYYVCKYSGERVAEVLENKDEFDEEGHVTNRHDAISAAPKGVVTQEHMTFALSLKNLQSEFKSANPGEDVMYLLLSLMQVLPDEKQLAPLLGVVRSESDKLLSRFAGKTLPAKAQNDVNLALAVYGFNATVILMQTHRPQLVPRRSFGSQPLVLRGFPRDTSDANDCPLVDSLLSVLQRTFESYPTTFRGASVVFLRAVLNDRKAVKKVVVASMTKQFLPKFRDELMMARDTIESSSAADSGYVLQQSFRPVVTRLPAVLYTPTENVTKDGRESRFVCAGSWMRLLLGSRFSYAQENAPIVEALRPSRRAVEVVAAPSAPDGAPPATEDVKRRIKIKVPAFAPIQAALKQENASTLRALLLRFFSLVALNPSAAYEIREYIRAMRPAVEGAIGDDASLLRDFYKGILLEFGTMVHRVPPLAVAIERAYAADETVKSLLSNAADTRKTIDALSTKERTEFRSRLRRMPDALREETMTLVNLGLAPYLISKSDREGFLQQLQQENLVAPEEMPPVLETDEIPADRDVGPQGEPPTEGEVELQYDEGSYGDRRARVADGEEAYDGATYDLGEDFGN